MVPAPIRGVLENDWVRLEPAGLQHAAGLFEASQDDRSDIFHHLFFGPFADRAAVEAWLRREAGDDGKMTYAVFSKVHGLWSGTCSLLNIDTIHGGAEIGSIWHRSATQGSVVNKATCLLLLTYLFTTLGYRRVVWKCDTQNAVSKAAARSIGFRHEGTFRKHLMIKGRSRDTDWFAIIEDDWPLVREHLERSIRSKAAAALQDQEERRRSSRAVGDRLRPAEIRATVTARFGHTNLIARDWKRLSRFYQEVFGCIPVPPERHYEGADLERGTGVPGAALDGEHLLLPGHGPAGPTLEIYTYTLLAEGPHPAVNRPGLAHLAFSVDDVTAARTAVLDGGGTPVGDVVTLQLSTGARVTWCYVADPEGNIIEVQSWAYPQRGSDVTGGSASSSSFH
jgi:RimJ/RimL family protein N-acetyltransferase/catechol 2,3-dioxygenase-like lactoylglutathione lyase family enzyme